MKEKTLTQIKEEMKITRRAIQGYEKEGLVKASGRTKRGYLLYDEAAQERLKIIKFYQDIGFEVKQIKNIIDAPRMVKKEELIKKRKEIMENEKRLNQLLKQVDEMIEKL